MLIIDTTYDIMVEESWIGLYNMCDFALNTMYIFRNMLDVHVY